MTARFSEIGEFFYVFSILDQWIFSYLSKVGGYTESELWDMSCGKRLSAWKEMALMYEDKEDYVEDLFARLNKIILFRNKLAHTFWSLGEDEILGRFRRRGAVHEENIAWNDIVLMIAVMRDCGAAIDFRPDGWRIFA